MGRENAQDRRLRREKKATKKKQKEVKAKEKEARAEARAEAAEPDVEDILRQVEAEAAALQQPKEKVLKRAPPARSHASLVPHPTLNELIMLGGELDDGRKTYVYADLYFFNIKKNEWRKVALPGAPPPRCAHQAVALPRNDGEMWVFGGEFSSPTGRQFYHYNDLWVLYLKEKRWEKVNSKGGPTPRSGHRMVAYKHYLVVFGGFFDNQKRLPKYYNDVHVFNLETREWHKLEFPAIFPSPSPRSGCQFVLGAEGIYAHGGYAKVRVKGEIERGEAQSDTWCLKSEEAADDDAAAKSKMRPIDGMQWSWTRIRCGGDVPTELSGTTIAYRNNTHAYAFGGSSDEQTEISITGRFCADLTLFNSETKKWRKLVVRSRDGDRAAAGAGKKKAAKGTGEPGKGRRRRAQPAPSLPGSEAAADGAAAGDNANDSTSSTDSSTDSSSDDEGDEAPQLEAASSAEAAAAASPRGLTVEAHMQDAGNGPSPRMNAAMAVKGNRLYVYGGIYELKDKQVTFSDFYALDVAKLDTWQRLADNDDKTRALFELEDSSSSEDEYEDEDEDGEGDEDDDENEAGPAE